MLHCGYSIPYFWWCTKNKLFRIMAKKFNYSLIRLQCISPHVFVRLDRAFRKMRSGLDVFLCVKRLTTLPHSSDTWRIWEIVIIYSTQPVLSKNSSSSFNVALDILAIFWINFLLVFSSVLDGTLVLGNVNCCVTFSLLVDLYCLHCILWYIKCLWNFLTPSPDWYLPTRSFDTL